MKDPHETVEQVHTFVDDVDWEAVETGLALSATAIRFCRRHPWTLVGAGAAIAALGGWFMLDDRRNQGHAASPRHHAPDNEAQLSHAYAPAP